MNKVVILISIVLLIFGCRKDPVDNCANQITPYSTAYFFEDALQLTYKQVSSDSNHVGFNQTALHEQTLKFYHEKLSVIYNAANRSSGSLRDIIYKWKVHFTKKVDLNSFTMMFGDTLGLHREIRTNPGNTSNPYINELYLDYGFKDISIGNKKEMIQLKSMKSHNIRHITAQLNDMDEIWNAWFVKYNTDGPSIVHFSYIDYDIFIFEYAWDDCPTGCLYRHFWEVKVDYNCAVSLVQEYGDELPD